MRIQSSWDQEEGSQCLLDCRNCEFRYSSDTFVSPFRSGFVRSGFARWKLGLGASPGEIIADLNEKYQTQIQGRRQIVRGNRRREQDWLQRR